MPKHAEILDTTDGSWTTVAVVGGVEAIKGIMIT